MLSKCSIHPKRLGLKMSLALLLLLLLSSQVSAASACKRIKGKLTLQSFTGPDCTSPVGLCATGTLTGSLAGTALFIGSSLIQSADTPTTAVVFVTQDTTISTDSGVLLTKDSLALSTNGNGEFAGVNTIIGGTGAWAGATGRYTSTGTFLTSTGAGEGTYSGLVCTP